MNTYEIAIEGSERTFEVKAHEIKIPGYGLAELYKRGELILACNKVLWVRRVKRGKAS